ncbi:hypothetical protein QVD17_30340 [Tagetes erecta]|uniref:Uncharacterized protein n=1 Tax=Tagetes erecta TaxID=13708 RepID=A0AAD8K3H0_TARER|nr:hypothetical protein QVD17_30340 [Tagetes erecta]
MIKTLDNGSSMTVLAFVVLIPKFGSGGNMSLPTLSTVCWTWWSTLEGLMTWAGPLKYGFNTQIPTLQQVMHMSQVRKHLHPIFKSSSIISLSAKIRAPNSLLFAPFFHIPLNSQQYQLQFNY